MRAISTATGVLGAVPTPRLTGDVYVYSTTSPIVRGAASSPRLTTCLVLKKRSCPTSVAPVAVLGRMKPWPAPLNFWITPLYYLYAIQMVVSEVQAC